MYLVLNEKFDVFDGSSSGFWDGGGDIIYCCMLLVCCCELWGLINCGVVRDIWYLVFLRKREENVNVCLVVDFGFYVFKKFIMKGYCKIC